jgi:hypothetical protein
VELRLERDGSIGTLLLRMVLECSPTTAPVRPGLSISQQGSGESDRRKQNWILLRPEQAKQLADYLHSLHP